MTSSYRKASTRRRIYTRQEAMWAKAAEYYDVDPEVYIEQRQLGKFYCRFCKDYKQGIFMLRRRSDGCRACRSGRREARVQSGEAMHPKERAWRSLAARHKINPDYFVRVVRLGYWYCPGCKKLSAKKTFRRIGNNGLFRCAGCAKKASTYTWRPGRVANALAYRFILDMFGHIPEEYRQQALYALAQLHMLKTEPLALEQFGGRHRAKIRKYVRSLRIEDIPLPGNTSQRVSVSSEDTTPLIVVSPTLLSDTGTSNSVPVRQEA